MSEIPLSVNPAPQLHAILCAVMASYTLIGVLDHERWMKEWGDDHEAVAVLHLRMPILSAAAVMGIGGYTAVEMVSMSSIELQGVRLETTAFWVSLAAVISVASILAMLSVARMDAFGGVNRVQRLKDVILKRHTLTEIKRHKGLGKRAAYFSKLEHIVGAGVIMAVGGILAWALHIVALSGEFVVVWRAWPITFLVASMLVFSVASTWFLFRVLVWKPAHEPLRPICAAFMGCFVWATTFLGQRYAVRFEYPEGRSPTTSYGWVLNRSDQYGQWLLLLLLFFAVMTQYAIALELRLAYCGLQNANLDLQMLAGMSGGEENSRRSSRHNRAGSKNVSQTPHSPVSRSKVSSSGASGGGAKTGPLSPSLTMALTAAQIKPPTRVVSAVAARVGSSIGLASPQLSRNIRVQPVDADKVYGIGTTDDQQASTEEGVLDVEQPAKVETTGWDSVRTATVKGQMEADLPQSSVDPPQETELV